MTESQYEKNVRLIEEARRTMEALPDGHFTKAYVREQLRMLENFNNRINGREANG